jgi:integrase
MIGCRPLSQLEVSLILAELKSTRDKTLFTLGLYTGFRIQEMLSLKVSDVYKNDTVLDRVTVQRKNMKGKRTSRTVLLHPSVKVLIASLVNETRLSSENYLFLSAKGLNQAITREQAWKILKKAVEKTGLQGKIALHSTRKTFAGKIYDKLGKNIFKTAKALGHKNPMSTVSYLSFRNEEIDEAILTIDNEDLK